MRGAWVTRVPLAPVEPVADSRATSNAGTMPTTTPVSIDSTIV